VLRDKTGNKLFRRVEVRIVFPEHVYPPANHVYRAGPRQGYGPENVDKILMDTTDKLDSLYPFWDFKLSELKPEGRTARYAFTFAGYRPQQGVDPAAHSSVTEIK
jgi:hypothetical protein